MDIRTGKKVLGRLGFLYGAIISLVNYIGFLIPSNGNMPVQETEEYLIWLNCIETNNVLINLISVFSFVSPLVLCVIYAGVCDEKNIKRRIINIPLVYSAIGATGWIFTTFFETIFLVVEKIRIGFSISQILTSSFLNITQICLFIFTLGFFIMDTIHRTIVLPKYFPEGNLTKQDGSVRLSVKLIFVIMYFSIGIFPIFFMFSSFYNISFNYNFEIPKSIYVVLSFILVFGFAIVMLIAEYFSRPLKKLNGATGRIKEGNYSQRVNVISCDDFGDLADSFNDMAQSLDDKTKKIYAIQDSIIRGMAVMVESRDNSTGGHINRTSDCVKIFVEKIKQGQLNGFAGYDIDSQELCCLSNEFFASVIKAAPMHDLGKIAIDDAVLRKPSKFTDEEYEMMKRHSAEGARIVESVLHEVDDLQFKKIAVNVAHYHHEKWNGEGYPEKISGTQIPLEARIMALADVFDALVSKRCYKDSFGFDKAFSIIQDSLGNHFDPNLGKIFLGCRADLENLYEGYGN